MACRIVLDVSAGADLVLSVAVAAGNDVLEEVLAVAVDGSSQDVREVQGPVGTRLHRVVPDADGRLTVDYRARVAEAAPVGSDELERIEATRPSRYCASDRLAPVVADLVDRDLRGHDQVRAVVDWVGGHLSYVPGSSGPLDGALDTYLSRQGVCRDYAHLVVACLRSLDVPARLVSVYAPGLEPMDFHAVAEAWVEGSWHVVDATRLAPRQTLVRIATGRDAADTAFLTVLGGTATLVEMSVLAIVDGELPVDDGHAPVRVG